MTATTKKKLKSLIDISVIGVLFTVLLTGCSSMQSVPYQQPSTVKVFTEEVKLEIYQPPLPQEISMRDIQWYVMTNTPCKPATGINKNPKYFTTEKYQSEEYTKEDGTTSRRAVRDEAGKRILREQLKGEDATSRRAVRDEAGKRILREQLKGEDGKVIQVCGNMEQKIAELEKKIGGEFVMMGISVKGYENMAYNLQEIKRYLNQQKEIILYYREATGGLDNDSKEDWLDKNKENQTDQVEDAKRDNEAQASELAQPVVEKASGFSIKKLIPGLPTKD